MTAEPTIEALLGAAVTSARSAWPTIILDEGEFRQCLEERAGRGPEAARALSALCVDELYLAQACARGDVQALDAFDRRYLAQVPAFLARHRARDIADEVRQVLRERLLVPRDGGAPRIAGYSGRGSLASWLRVAALRAATNLVRGDKPRAAVDEGMLAELADVPELRVLEGRYRAAFREAFRAGFAALPADVRALLKLHFLDGVTVRKLGPILGVSHATAGRRLLAAQTLLGELVLRALGERIEATPSELGSVVRALISRLDVSLSTFLPES